MTKNYCAVLVEDCADCDGNGYALHHGGSEVCTHCAGKGEIWTPTPLAEVLPELRDVLHDIALDIEARSHD